MSNDFTYRSLADLLEMDIAELEACWEDVPTDDQTYLKNVLAKEVRKHGTMDDAGEVQIIRRFVKQYQEMGSVPANNVWLKVPPHMREQFKSDEVIEEEPTTSRRYSRAGQDSEGLPPWLALLLLGLAFLAIPIAFYFFFLRGGGDSSSEVIVDLSTAPATIAATPTPQPTTTPTPTPFALDNVDRSIGRGDRQDRTYYPVLLQVFDAVDATQPSHAFVVQEHEISIAEWHFDSNPDIASWVGGLLVRPVLGIPYSEQNDELFQTLTTGSSFIITMNTGDILRYNYTTVKTVGRTETTIFRQTHPGLVLVLIGQEDDNGRPTNERLVIEAEYDLSQELDRVSQITPPSVMVGQVAYPLEDVAVQVERTSLRPGDNLATGMVYALVDIQITNGGNNALSPASLPVVLEDDSHTRFLPVLDIVGECGLWQQEIPPNTAQCISLTFAVPQLTRAYLKLAETVYTLDFAPPEAAPNINSLEVLLRRVNYDDDALAVDLYIYNPLSQSVEIHRDDLWLALGYSPNPNAPHQPPLFAEQDVIHTIPPNAAWEIVFQFPYDGQTHGTLGILGHIYAVEISE